MIEIRAKVSKEVKAVVDSLSDRRNPEMDTQAKVIEFLVNHYNRTKRITPSLFKDLEEVSAEAHTSPEELMLDAIERRVKNLKGQMARLEVLKDKTNEEIGLSKGVRGVAFTRIDNLVKQIMEENDKAHNWWEKSYITQTVLMHQLSTRAENVKRYLEKHQEEIDEHHKKHSEKHPENPLDEGHNRRKSIKLQQQNREKYEKENV